jgi:hypothetical protein
MKVIELVDFEDLVGLYWLSGCDEETITFPPETKYEYPEDANCLNFVLDGKTYTAKEDPDDGYRSSMDKLFISDHNVINSFTPITVLVSHIEKDGDLTCDILRMIDTKNGKTVIEVGTGNTDDYYPYFIASFVPENMSTNDNKE